MTNAVIDNSTLTAVERVIGHIPIDQNYDLSGDLAAFEMYLCTLLFYDQPVRIDDYKPEFSENRSAHFPELGVVAFESDGYETLIQQAKELAAEFYLRVHGGDLQDDLVSDFLRDIDLYVCPSWHMQSSDFYLRIRLLADESGSDVAKYSPLMSAIFDQLSENKRTPRPIDWKKELLDSNGRPIPRTSGILHQGKHEIGRDVNAFAAGLNWLSLRSIFYSLVAEYLKATAITHPIRNDFLGRYMVDKLSSPPPNQRAAVLGYFKAAALDVVDRSNEVLGGTAFKLHSPLVSAWAASVAGGPRKAREHVLSLRDSAEALALRARMREIEALHRAEDTSAARRQAASLFRDFTTSIQSFFRKYGSRSEDPMGSSAEIVSLSGSFKVLPLLDKVKSMLPARAKSVALLRNITLDLLRSPTLGSVADVLRSDAIFGSDHYESVYRPKFEQPRFRHTHSSWKKPM